MSIAAEGNAKAHRREPCRGGRGWRRRDQRHVRLCAFSGARALCRRSVDLVATVLALPAGARHYLCRHPLGQVAPRRGAATRCLAHRSGQRQPRAAQTLCYFQSLRWLDTGIAVLLFYTFPVVTLAVQRFCFRQQVALSSLLCVIVIFVGAALIAVPGLHNGAIDPRGLAWAFPARSSMPSTWRPMPGCWRVTRR